MTIQDNEHQQQKLLNLTDRVALDCLTAGVPYPAEWQAFKLAVRAVDLTNLT